jgi:hypothetical protein
MGKKFKITEDQLKRLVENKNRIQELNEDIGLLGYQNLHAKKNAQKVAKLLVNMNPDTLGSEQTGAIKDHYVKEFCKHLTNIILGGTENMDNDGEDYGDNMKLHTEPENFTNDEINESVEKIKSQFKRFM